MVLLIAGTLAQHQQGLYYAQQTYFSVYYFWLWGIIPLPGAYTTLTAIFLNLLCKLVSDTWRVKKLGTIITHLSALLLLLGGFLTAHFSQEGYMDITEGTSVNYFNDYYNTELVITTLNKKKIINPKNPILQSELNKFIPADLNIVYCNHCAVKNNPKKLIYLPKPKDNEQIMPVLTLNINQNHNIYLAVNNSYRIQINNHAYLFEFRFKRTYLPFAIKLNSFKKELHPGTNIVREYSSDVTLTDNTINWHGIISMNQPLRYKGYTFYQASFYKNDNQYTTVLAAVYNTGQNFPYIASIVLCLGVLVHLFQRSNLRLRLRLRFNKT
ncbi:MAG: cytochrome c biogenesis protein ResB [Gammaproteobacteria bacterium]|nr:cytochrome c biogenesis protein ResB [Gammaproteobacteria bacterium]